ncbi:MAG: alpha/beta fold hydrolase [Pseudomonadota bacterium]
MPKVSVNGINLNYEVHGEGHPIILLPGYGGTLETWRHQVAAFSREFRLITCDLRGHGGTDSPASPDEYSADIVIEDVLQLMKTLGVDKAVMGGHSMGGYLAMRFYLAHPGHVSALVLIGAGPGFRNPIQKEAWNRRCRDYAEVLEAQGIEAFVARFPGVLSRNGSGHNPVGLAHAARGVMAQFDSYVTENLGQIKVPTLIIDGERDKRNVPASQYMARSIPGAQCAVVPDAGHAASLDNPKDFNKIVLDFLRSNLQV